MTGTTQSVADRSLQAPELLAIAAFAGVLGVSIWILSERGVRWVFALSAEAILATEASAKDLKRDLALHSERYYDENALRLRRRGAALQVGLVLLAMEAAAWLVDLS